jgi:hypothetical protein
MWERGRSFLSLVIVCLLALFRSSALFPLTLTLSPRERECPLEGKKLDHPLPWGEGTPLEVDEALTLSHGERECP